MEEFKWADWPSEPLHRPPQLVHHLNMARFSTQHPSVSGIYKNIMNFGLCSPRKKILPLLPNQWLKWKFDTRGQKFSSWTLDNTTGAWSLTVMSDLIYLGVVLNLPTNAHTPYMTEPNSWLLGSVSERVYIHVTLNKHGHENNERHEPATL